MSLRLLGGGTSAADITAAVAEAVEGHTPGILLGYSERTTSDVRTTGGAITGVSVTVVGQGRPVDIEARVTKGFHSAANAPMTFAIMWGTVCIASDEQNSFSTTTGRAFYCKRTMTLTDGVSYTFTLAVAHGLAGTMTWYADDTATNKRPMHLAVTSR